MRIVLILILITGFLGEIKPIRAQINVCVYDEKGQSMPQINVLLEDTYLIKSDIKGNLQLPESFTLSRFLKSNIKIKDNQYVFKAKESKDSTASIQVEKCYILKGNIKTKNNFPLAGIKVMLLNIQGFQAVETDLNGNFQLKIPQRIYLKKLEIAAFDASLARLSLDYDINIKEDMSMELCVEKYPRPIQKVKLLDQDHQVMKNTTIFIDGKEYISNQYGMIDINHKASEMSAFRVDYLQISSMKFLDKEANMYIYLYSTDNVNLPLSTHSKNLGNRWIKNQD
jgi:hypothetical protein